MFLKGSLQANRSNYKQLRLYTTGDLNYCPQLFQAFVDIVRTWYFKSSYKKVGSRKKSLEKIKTDQAVCPLLHRFRHDLPVFVLDLRHTVP